MATLSRATCRRAISACGGDLMARTATAACDADCGATRDLHGPRPKTWWTLDQHSERMTSGTHDFCSLSCLQRWVSDPRVRAAFPDDFKVVAVGVAV